MKDPSQRLIRYVIATCYPKMIRWLQNFLSLKYIRSLNEITDRELTTLKFGNSNPNPASKGEIDNDKLFLRFMVPLLLIGKLKTKPTKLTTLAEIVAKGQPFEFYTKDTCTEFHELLKELLKLFQASLEEVAKLRGDAKESTQGSGLFIEAVERVRILGYGLHKLVRGSVLWMHLKHIAPLLRNWTICEQAQVSMPAPDGEEEPDEELKAVQPFIQVEGVQIPLWMSYSDWFRLIIAYIDAVDILVGYVTGKSFQHDTILVQVMVPPEDNMA